MEGEGFFGFNLTLSYGCFCACEEGSREMAPVRLDV